MRIILTGAMLFALASTAFAAEHYVEVWNPPEARTGDARPLASGKRSHAKKLAKRRLPSANPLAPRRVAGPAMRASAAIVPVTPSAPATNRHPLIAPKIGPDGHILQVGFRVPARRAPAGMRVQ